METQKNVMNVEETMAYIGVKRNLLFNMVKDGRIPSIKMGKRRVFHRATIDEWLRKQSMESVANAKK